MGQYATPKKIVDFILNSVGFTGAAVLSSRIFEPCFGSGAILVKIVERIIDEGLAAGLGSEKIAGIIQANVFGIEKDKALYDKAIVRLNNLLSWHGIFLSDWTNLINGDALLLYKNYYGMDFVVGNPPFVRTHNIPTEYREIVKNFRFSAKGLLDLYVVFYEIGIKLLKQSSGRLGYISPNSFLRNSSQQGFRDFLIENRYITAVYDFKDSHVFESADTYTCVCILSRANPDSYEIEYGGRQSDRMSVIPYGEFRAELLGRAWNLHPLKDMLFLRKNRANALRLGDISDIQNGITTQANDVYIGKVFNDHKCTVPYMGKGAADELAETVFFQNGRGDIVPIESAALRRCVKGSRFNGKLGNDYIIFPYMKACGNSQKGYVPLSETDFQNRSPLAYQYLQSMRSELVKRDKDVNTEWFLFGRRQGLKNSRTEKIVFKNFAGKHTAHVAPHILDEDIIVYSGIYMVQRAKEYSLEMLCGIISSEDFMKYIKLTGKDLAGGYVYFGTKQIQEFGVDGIGCYADKGA